MSARDARKPFLSLALRTALASALFGLAIAAAAAAMGYVVLSRQLQNRSGALLHGRAELIVHIVSELPSRAAAPADAHRLRDVLIGHDDVHLALFDPTTKRMLASFSPVGTESFVELAGLALYEQKEWRATSGLPLLGEHGRASAANGELVDYVVSIDLREDLRFLAGFLRTILFAAPLLLLGVAVGSWAIAHTGLAPLRRFRRTAAAISTRSLEQRIQLTGLPRELHELGEEFNAMLARIDDGYRRLQEFSADLAHELRTPVATLLGRSQVALSQPRSVEQLRDVLESNIDELERISRLISDMLFIAQADESRAVLQIHPVPLDEEAARVAEYLSLHAEERGVRIEVSGSGTVGADRALAQRAITNLLTNAIRHADPASTVRVAISSAPAGGVCLSVANDGEPIPEAQLARLFDRFYRADPSRTRDSGGAGLGLAIVRSIMRAHGGDASARNDTARRRTVFELFFPAAAQAPAP
jgi:two-component system heavy metal sensor histidine kinase CusS